jgi:hypothetical protein
VPFGAAALCPDVQGAPGVPLDHSKACKDICVNNYK